MPSRPREFHPEPLTDSGREPLDSSGSCHRAKAAAFHRLSGSSRYRLTRSYGDDLPPSLHGHCPASSLLRGSPPLSGASVLSASRLEPLAPFPWHRRPGSHVPYKSQIELRAAYMPDAAWAVSGIPQTYPGRRVNPRF